MATNSDDETQALKRLVDAGVDLAGSVSGALIGSVVAGPPGTIAGGAAGPLITHALRAAAEFSQRHLSRREQVRVGATLTFAIAKINSNRASGKLIRQDDFFQEQPGNRASADEILEGILLAVQREHQEKKLKFYGNLLANIVFHPEVDRGLSNQLVKIVERISYRQLVLLAFFERNNADETSLQYLDNPETNIRSGSIAEDIYDLMNQSVLARISSFDMYTAATMPFIRIDLIGLKLCELMELNEIEEADMLEISSLLGLRKDGQA